MRLDKAVAHAGHGSRREIDGWIRSGAVAVDGAAARRGDMSVDPLRQRITLMGADIDYAEQYTVMLHKPAGFITATEDRRERTVLELLGGRERRWGLFPAGRLDKDATGLLLLTTDGALAHRVMSPRSGISKEYFVTADGILSQDMPPRFAAGLRLADGTLCRPAELTLLDEHRARVVVEEGKYHQVKRMFAACGVRVTALHRASVGGLVLDPALGPGRWRRLKEADIELLFV